MIIGHPGPVIINGKATFDGNLFLTHGVTIGRDIRGKRAGAPHFGKNVCIRCNSTVVGGITIGDDVLIAPNTFVNFDNHLLKMLYHFFLILEVYYFCFLFLLFFLRSRNIFLYPLDKYSINLKLLD